MTNTDGSVSAEIVILVLKAVGVSATILDGSLVTIKDTNPKAFKLDNGTVNRRALQWYSNKYGARIEWFYHPGMISPAPVTAQ